MPSTLVETHGTVDLTIKLSLEAHPLHKICLQSQIWIRFWRQTCEGIWFWRQTCEGSDFGGKLLSRSNFGGNRSDFGCKTTIVSLISLFSFFFSFLEIDLIFFVFCLFWLRRSEKIEDFDGWGSWRDLGYVEEIWDLDFLLKWYKRIPMFFWNWILDLDL